MYTTGRTTNSFDGTRTLTVVADLCAAREELERGDFDELSISGGENQSLPFLEPDTANVRQLRPSGGSFSSGAAEPAE